MVGLEQMKPTLVSDDGSVAVYSVSNCYVIPLRFYAMHLNIGNVEFKIKPEDMSSNYRVTTRFCGEYLYDRIAGQAGLYPDFAIYDVTKRKWFGVTPDSCIKRIVFNTGEKEYGVQNVYPYEIEGITKDSVKARVELKYNLNFLNICTKRLSLIHI